MIDHIYVKYEKQWTNVVSEVNRLESREVPVEELRACASAPKESLLSNESKELISLLVGYLKGLKWIKSNLKQGKTLVMNGGEKEKEKESAVFKALALYCDAFWLNDNIRLVLERDSTTDFWGNKIKTYNTVKLV